MALRAGGWFVTGRDRDPESAARALSLGAVDEVGDDPDPSLTVVATPVGAVAAEVTAALATTQGVVTDVGSVKAPMIELMRDPRYVGGHPMAGSEAEGVEGSRPDMFAGATWVLTPTRDTGDDALGLVRGLVTSFGAEVLALPPDQHDRLVALVSHVPHLTAVTLMRRAAARGEEHRALLRLAAGGFRDMTRIAAGHPGIWPDICAGNRDAIVAELDELLVALGDIRRVVAEGRRHELVELLEASRQARLNLPGRYTEPADLAEVRLPVPDRAGVLAEVTTTATELGVNIVDIEIAHSVEGDRGTLILVVERAHAAPLAAALGAAGYRTATSPLE